MKIGCVLVLALSACGSGTGDHAACVARALATCQKLDACIVNGVSIRYGDEATCEARVAASCLAGLGAAHTGSTVAGEDACAGAIPGSACADFQSNTLPACEPGMGTLENGTACAFSTQCTSSFCAIGAGARCGTCAPLSIGGDSCATTPCSRGLSCVAATMTCQPLGGASAACNANEPCGPGLSCVTPAGMSNGTCEASGTKVGDACDPARVKAAACDAQAGVTCASATRTCVALVYANAGAACGNVSGTKVVCDGASSCVLATGANAGTCVALVKEGEACDTNLGPSCMTPARCITGAGSSTGTCALPDAKSCT